MADIQHATRKGDNMRHDDTRDNTTTIEATIIAADAHEDTRDDIPEDDGQPSEYEEWQDYMGGDDWDHGQYDDCGW